MPTPIEIKCVNCEHFKEFKKVPLEKGVFKYLCLAYPDGIPKSIRSWEIPHVSVNKKQVGDFVFKEASKRRKNELSNI